MLNHLREKSVLLNNIYYLKEELSRIIMVSEALRCYHTWETCGNSIPFAEKTIDV